MSKLSTRRIFSTLVLTQTVASASAAYKAETYYDNANGCSSPANEFQLTTGACSISSCAATTWHSHTSAEVTCGVTSPADHATSVFGNDAVYIYMRVYADDACTQEQSVSGYRLYDGHCIKESATSSFAYSLRTDTTVRKKVYTSTDCTGPVSSSVQWSSSDVRSNKCVSRVQLYALNPAYTSQQGFITETYFTDASCTKPNRIPFTPRDVFVAVSEAKCQKNADGFYYTRGKNVTSDPKASAVGIFGAESTANSGYRRREAPPLASLLHLRNFCVVAL